MTLLLKRLFLFTAICLITPLAAQKPYISGKVQDSETYEAIPNVNISFSRTKLGCATDKNGEFSVVIDSLPVYMIISHLGYETRRIWLEKSSTSSGINILLKPAVRMLEEVEIKSSREPVPFFNDDEYSILDYEVDNTLVYLLVYRFRLAKAQLICLADDGDTIATSAKLPFRPTGLFADCLGYLHVVSSDSSYQVYLKKDTIVFPYHTEIKRFLSKMLNCVASDEDWLYFRKESADHLRIDFYRIHRRTKKLQNLVSSSDDFKRNMLRHNPIDRYLLMMDTLPNSASEIAEYSWVRKILYTPNASVLKLIGDSITLFNTTDGSLELFDRTGKFLYAGIIPVMDRKTEKWTMEIYYDEMKEKPYTSFLKNGKIYIYSIDVANGALKPESVTHHIFPRKIIIDNHYLFYLYDLPGMGDNRQLYRQKL